MNNDIIITNHTPQDITITQDDNQLIFINGGGEVIGVTDVRVNGTSVVSNNIAYVIVPTLTSQLTNDSGFITTESDPTVPSYVKAITLADINNWNSKQDTLVSGTNIKTINNTSLLGSGNIDIQGGGTYEAGTGIDITNGVISNTITSYNDLSNTPTIPTLTSQLTNDSDYVTSEDLSEVAFTGSYSSLSDTPENLSEFTNDVGFIDNTVNNLVNYTNTTTLNSELATKQDTLVSGTNIKTINNTSLLGSGNIDTSNIIDYKGSLLLYYGSINYNRSWTTVTSIENLNSTFGNIKSGYTRWWRLIAWKNDNQSGGNGLGIGLFSTDNYIRFNFTGSQGSYVCSDYLNTGTDELFEIRAILPPTSTSTTGTLYSLILQVYDVETGTDPNNI